LFLNCGSLLSGKTINKPDADLSQGILHALQSIPGLAESSDAMLLVKIGEERQAFGSAQKLAAWAGVYPVNNGSAGTDEGQQETRRQPPSTTA
jgi:transposase